MERIESETASLFSGIRVTSLERGAIDGFHYVIAECETRGARRHRRMMVDEPSQPLLNNKPLFYVDTYQTGGDDRTYVYARHLADPSRFFTALNNLLEEEKLREYEDRKYKAIFNLNGEYSERQIVFPYFDESLTSDVCRFCRLFFPFGDVAAEFGPPFPSSQNELDDARQYRQLTKRLESPLLGCDVSRTLAMGKLLVETHWSARKIPTSVLQTMLEEAARASVTA